MSDYTKLTDFASKDTLPSGNANKIVKGTEIDDEFEAIETAIATKSNISSPAFTGTPTAPTAADGTNTTQIATTAFVLTNGVPSGAILMWSGSVASIPSGWSLCDGTNSTPDLRNRFVVGAGDTYSVDATGGSADAIVVSHTHSVSDPGHQHDGTAYYRGEGADTSSDPSGNASTFYHENSGHTRSSSNSFIEGGVRTETDTTGISISSTGSSGTNKNLPPYYALAYIMKD